LKLTSKMSSRSNKTNLKTSMIKRNKKIKQKLSKKLNAIFQKSKETSKTKISGLMAKSDFKTTSSITLKSKKVNLLTKTKNTRKISNKTK